MSERWSRFVLVGDLGGTNCRFQLYCFESFDKGQGETGKKEFDKDRREGNFGDFELRSSSTKPTTRFNNFSEMIIEFLSESHDHFGDFGSRRTLPLCVFAVCGPVVKESAILLAEGFGEGGWRISQKELAKDIESFLDQTEFAKKEDYNDGMGVEVHLLNDFHAVGLSLMSDKIVDKVVCLHEGTHGKDPDGVIACLGPGTGLGTAFGCKLRSSSTCNSNQSNGRLTHEIFCSEAGMADFNCRSDIQYELRKYMLEKLNHSHLEVERIVSGSGIKDIYLFFAEKYRNVTIESTTYSQEIDQLVERDVDKGGGAAVVVEYSRPPYEDSTCKAAVDLFLTCLGQELGNASMRFLPYCGMYIAGGGIISKMLEEITDGRVLSAYLDKGHASEIVQNVPLYLVDEAEMGLLGVVEKAKDILTSQALDTSP